MNRTTSLVCCVSVMALLNVASVMAQELKPLPASPQANPIDPSSLNAAPAFGESAPVRKPQADSAANELPPEHPTAIVESEWQPKFRVVLITTGFPHDKVAPVNQLAVPGFFESPDPLTRNAIRRMGNDVITAPQASAILMCDDVAVDAKTSEFGQLVYAFSGKGKVRLEIDDYTVNGDSVSSKDGQLHIANAVVTSRMAKLSAENLQISLPIVGVRVESGSTKPDDQMEALKPKPDPTGDNDISPKAPSANRNSNFVPSH
jgi:hypothetical protein